MSNAALKAVATGQAVESKNPVAAFSGFLDRFKPQMALALPKHLNPDRMARLAVTAFSGSEKLQQCDPKTIVASIMNASVMGLEIGVDGQGYLVPYGKTCTFVPGWKGLTDLVNRSGRATVWTGAVFEGDEFDYQMGDNPFVRHRPGDEDDPAKITHVYAIGKVNGQQVPVIEVWTIRKIWKHRDKYNKVGRSHYSFRDPEMYARKIPLLQVIKYMPKSIELQNALAAAGAAERGASVTLEGDFVHITEPEIPLAEETPKPAQQDQPTDQQETKAVTYAEVMDGITNAESLEALDFQRSRIKQVADEAQQAELNVAAAKRVKELKTK